MRNLLDTHTLYWYMTADPQLSAVAQQVIQDAANEIFLSPASLWEIAIKVSLGKWQILPSYEMFLETCLKQYGFRILPIEPAHTLAVSRMAFPTSHRDPFDRLLIAQSLVEQMPIVSVDKAFDPYGVTRIW